MVQRASRLSLSKAESRNQQGAKERKPDVHVSGTIISPAALRTRPGERRFSDPIHRHLRLEPYAPALHSQQNTAHVALRMNRRGLNLLNVPEPCNAACHNKSYNGLTSLQRRSSLRGTTEFSLEANGDLLNPGPQCYKMQIYIRDLSN